MNSSGQNEVINRIQQIQRDILDLASFFPNGLNEEGLEAVKLSREAMRLSLYMLKNDAIGVREKLLFVESAYKELISATEDFKK